MRPVPGGCHVHLGLELLAGAGQLGQHLAVLDDRAGRVHRQPQDGAGAGRGEGQLGAAGLVQLVAERRRPDARLGGVLGEPAVHLALLGGSRRGVLA